jgi:hypothetical protein
MAINTNPSSRRALLAAAAGGTVALVAESLARPLTVRAGSDGDVVLGDVNESPLTTILNNTTSPEPVLRVESVLGLAIDARSHAGGAIGAISDEDIAIVAIGKQRIGVVAHGGEPDGLGGSNGGKDTCGVLGFSGAGYGVAGIVKSGEGVHAESDSGVGVYAKSTTGRGVVAESGAIGIESHTTGTTTEEDMFGSNVIGVWGIVDGPGGFGIAVKGDGANGCGVLGQGGHCGVHGYGERVGVEGKSLAGAGVGGQTESGVALRGEVFQGGTGLALAAGGPVQFDSAGRGNLVGGKAKVTPGVALDDGSKVLITLMRNPGAQALTPYVEVTPGPAGTGFFRVHVPNARVGAVPFAYFVIS